MVCPHFGFFLVSVYCRKKDSNRVSTVRFREISLELSKSSELTANIKLNQSAVSYSSIHSRESALEVKATEIRPIMKKVMNPRGRAMRREKSRRQ